MSSTGCRSRCICTQTCEFAGNRLTCTCRHRLDTPASTPPAERCRPSSRIGLTKARATHPDIGCSIIAGDAAELSETTSRTSCQYANCVAKKTANATAHGWPSPRPVSSPPMACYQAGAFHVDSSLARGLLSQANTVEENGAHATSTTASLRSHENTHGVTRDGHPTA